MYPVEGHPPYISFWPISNETLRRGPDARGDMDSNYIEACRLKEALLDATAPTRSISGYWIDENKKPILAYFGDSTDQENAHSVPVSC